MHIPKTKSTFIILRQHIAVRLFLSRLFLQASETIFHFLHHGISDSQISVFDFSLCDESILFDLVSVFFELDFEQVSSGATVEIHSQFGKDMVEGVILFLHFLVVASALLSLPAGDEVRHCFEDFVGSAQVLQDEVAVMEFEEPVVEFVFLGSPVPFLNILGFSLSRKMLEVWVFLAIIFLGLLAGEPDMALLAEKRLKVVSWDDLFLVFKQRVYALRTILLRSMSKIMQRVLLGLAEMSVGLERMLGRDGGWVWLGGFVVLVHVLTARQCIIYLKFKQPRIKAINISTPISTKTQIAITTGIWLSKIFCFRWF